MILMLVRILLSISSSSTSTRLSSNAGALPSRASTSSSIEFIPPPAEPARSSHPARWPRIRRTLFKSCPTNVRRVDKRPSHASFLRSTGEHRRSGLSDRGRGLCWGRDHDDPIDDLTDLEGPAERTDAGKGLRAPVVEDRDLVFAIRGSLRSNSGNGTSIITWPGVSPALRAIRSSARRRSFGSWNVASTDRVAAVNSSRSDAKTRLYSLRYLRRKAISRWNGP